MLDAAPNVHPLVVHFPIVLLLLALALEGGARFGRWSLGDGACAAAWSIAALAATTAALTGRLAADGLVDLDPALHARIGAHADIGWVVVGLAWAAAASRLSHVHSSSRVRALGSAVALLLGIAANVAMVVVSDRGGALVYQYAVGVRSPVAAAPPSTPSSPPPPDSDEMALSDDGTTLTWVPTARGVAGTGGAVWPAAGVAVQVDGEDEWLLPVVLGDVQVNAWLDVSRFDGEVAVLHHISETGSGAFVWTSRGSAELVHLKPTNETLDSSLTEPPTRTLSVNVSGSHQKGLIDGRVVAHGHARQLPPGAVGLRVQGKGLIALGRLEAVRLREPSP